jgi:N-terminal acetyltransferase B complex non-catalytic subunit
LIKQYFLRVGDKACCFEDLKPYLDLGEDELLKWTTFLESVPETFVSLCAQLQPLINVILERRPPTSFDDL